MTFKLTKDHYVLKEDIPDEQTFNKIIQAFVAIGGIRIDGYGSWPRRNVEEHFAIGLFDTNRIVWLCKYQIHDRTRATPQQILGEDYMKDPMYPNGRADDVVNVELTRKEVAIIKTLLGSCNGSLVTGAWYKFKNISNFSFHNFLTLNIKPHEHELGTALDKYFAPRKPAEKELRQAKIAELEEKLKELKEMDNG